MGNCSVLGGLAASGESPPRETFSGTIEGMLKFTQHGSLVTSLPPGDNSCDLQQGLDLRLGR